MGYTISFFEKCYEPKLLTDPKKDGFTGRITPLEFPPPHEGIHVRDRNRGIESPSHEEFQQLIPGLCSAPKATKKEVQPKEDPQALLGGTFVGNQHNVRIYC